ncbi:MAG: SUMF1/EgtB/PvdO family nonheme iron enzyme [Bacteroidales bacterium]|nr:SUMF1/EgtB/PvdO family nonheme iron enzyme [Bacteroidales bacterium]
MKKIKILAIAMLFVFVACAKEFTITLQSNDVNMGAVSGGGTYRKGTVINLLAIPKNTYKFVKWDDEDTSNPRSIVVEQNKTYTAIFAIDVQEDEGGDPTTVHTGIAVIDALASDMIRVEGGTFLMGAKANDTDVNINEKPQHNVTLSDFYICKYEVTQELWQTVMGTSPTYAGGWNDTYGKGDKYPAYYISWNDCDSFLVKLNKLTGLHFRLPTEAEWEYAAKGGQKSKGYVYAGSDTLENVAWCINNSDSKNHVVMQKQANELGLYDMTGNVFEWCSDWYSATYYKESNNATDPKGPSSGINRVNRGGSWGNSENSCRVVYRGCNGTDNKYYYRGFRIALSAIK